MSYESSIEILSFSEGVVYTSRGEINLVAKTTNVKVDISGFGNQELIASPDGLRIVNHGRENDWVDEQGVVVPGEDYTLELLVPWTYFWDWVGHSSDFFDVTHPHIPLHIPGCYREMGCVYRRGVYGMTIEPSPFHWTQPHWDI